jgi:antitoxin (DNA-binding transcriptional repressor) of toxin-antitoxin stability system
MSKSYTFSEARQNLSSVLDQAEQDGEVRIIRQNGQVYVIRPEKQTKSPLDVPGINVDITADEIVDIVREGRGG